MREFFLKRPRPEQALIVSAAASAALLAGAHLFEKVGRFIPCALCLDQREAHWAALGVALAGLAASILFRARIGAAAAVGAVALVYAVSAGLAFYHTGVEYKFWPGPPTCAGGAIVDAGSLTDALEKGPSGPGCEDAPWRLAGVSMAGYNLIFSAGLSALAFAAAVAAWREAQSGRRPGAAAP